MVPQCKLQGDFFRLSFFNFFFLKSLGRLKKGKSLLQFIGKDGKSVCGANVHYVSFLNNSATKVFHFDTERMREAQTYTKLPYKSIP
jgi:excinuclease UvrABC helicase subunit UvrB